MNYISKFIPFWFLNGELKEEELKRQIYEMNSKGITEFVVHARNGLKIPYLSKEWFNRIDLILNEAEKLGMKVWIYDEYNWASGRAYGEVIKNSRSFCQQYLKLSLKTVKGPCRVNLKTPKGKKLCVLAYKRKHSLLALNDIIDLTNYVENNNLVWNVPSGDWTIFFFTVQRSKWYPDVLNPKSVKRFLMLTHEKYFNNFKNKFGKIVRGFYTDEPAAFYYEVVPPIYFYYRLRSGSPVVPWTKGFLKKFREIKGYDLKFWLPAIFIDLEGSEKIRCDFWEVITRLYFDAYFKTIREWCEKHGVLFVGHVFAEDELWVQIRTEGNVLRILEAMHIPGVDHLYKGFKDPKKVFALKLACSAGNYLCSESLCEVFAGTGWDLTLEEIKKTIDRIYLSGINIINPHGLHYSIEGDRKRDWPPSQFYHQPTWKYYKILVKYVNRIGSAMEGEYMAQVAVLLPTTALWANYTPLMRTMKFKIIEDDLYYLSDFLARKGVDYCFIGENMLENFSVVNGDLDIKGRKYRLLIVPSATILRRSTYEKLKEIYNLGGKILILGMIPSKIIEEGSDKNLFREFYEGHRSKFKKEMVNKNTQGAFYIINAPQGIHKLKPENKVLDVIEKFCDPPLKILCHNEEPCDDILVTCRKSTGYIVSYIVNSSPYEKKFLVKVRGKTSPWMMNPENGDFSKVLFYKIEENATIIPLRLQPYGSTILYLKPYKDFPHIIDTNLEIEGLEIKNKKLLIRARGYNVEKPYIVVTLRDEIKRIDFKKHKTLNPLLCNSPWRFNITGENVLLIKNWRFELDEEDEGLEHFWHEWWYDESNWPVIDSGEWFSKILILRPSKLKIRYPVNVWYKTRFVVASNLNNIRILLDGVLGEYMMFINGRKVNHKPEKSSFDPEMSEVRIDNYLIQGVNTLALRVTCRSEKDGLRDPLRILGRFVVKYCDGLPVLEKLENTTINRGSWTEQGFPYYSGTGVYEIEVNVPEDYIKGHKLLLDLGEVKDVAEVWTNGRFAGIRPWRPYRLDITSFLEAGVNKIIIKVTNAPINFLEGVKRESGLLDEIKIIPYDEYFLEIDKLC